MTQKSPTPPVLSGHETFICRYAWLPKIVEALSEDPFLFKAEDSAMVRLGVGKNMVRSAKFWAEAAQIIQESNDGWEVTRFGFELLHEEGHDPYLERQETLWLIHWKIATNLARPLFYWEQMLNYWHRPEFSESEVLPFLERGLPTGKSSTSKRTIADGFRIFVNSYVPSRNRKGEIAEDNLDCPLAELGLVRPAGERLGSDHNREPIYTFNIGPKNSISAELLAYCIDDFWRASSKYSAEESLGFRAVSTDPGSPGQIFKLPESVLTPLMDGLSVATKGAMTFGESRSMQQVWRRSGLSSEDLLHNVYNSDS